MMKLLHTLFGHQWVNVVVVKESWLVVDCLQYSEIALFPGDIHQCTQGSLVSGRETSSSTTLQATYSASSWFALPNWLHQVFCLLEMNAMTDADHVPALGAISSERHTAKYQTILMKFHTFRYIYNALITVSAIKYK